MPNGFLPINKQDLIADGIDRPDFVYVSGDAYVDHSSFGTAIICRLLQSRGYSVALICQPDWRDPKSVQEYGEPRLGFLVSSGNMDSMVNHYTVAKKRRHQDAYSPGGAIGKRPDYAVIVYCNLIRQTYKRTPIIIGGIEASLRRLSHYDYWSDKVRRSILLDSGADLISSPTAWASTAFLRSPTPSPPASTSATSPTSTALSTRPGTRRASTTP